MAGWWNIAKLMTGWHSASGGQGIVPIEEVEQREIIRALTLCGGDVMKAVRALKMGKTTIDKKVRRWGYSIANRRLIHQASALAQVAARILRSLDFPVFDLGWARGVRGSWWLDWYGVPRC
jgi:hypothetical protein